MDWHPVQGGVVIFLGMLHAKETRISLCVPLQFKLYLYLILKYLRDLEFVNGLLKGALCSERVIFKVPSIIIFMGKLRFPSHPMQEQMQATSGNRPGGCLAQHHNCSI